MPEISDLIQEVMDAGRESTAGDERNLSIRFRFDVLGVPYTAVYTLEQHTNGGPDANAANWAMDVYSGRDTTGEPENHQRWWVSWESDNAARQYVTKPIRQVVRSDVSRSESTDCGFSVYGVRQDDGET